MPDLRRPVPQLSTQQVHLLLPPVQHSVWSKPHVLCYPSQDQENLQRFQKGCDEKTIVSDGYCKPLSWDGRYAWEYFQRTLQVPAVLTSHIPRSWSIYYFVWMGVV